MALPLPKVVSDVSPGGGVVTSMQGQNALTKSALENQYYGPSQQADIASKTTYARYLPAQIIGQVLSNPLAWQTMDKGQLQALVSQYANSVSNPPSIASLSGGQPSGGLISMLINRARGNQQPNNSMQNMPMGQNGNGLMPPSNGGSGMPNQIPPQQPIGQNGSPSSVGGYSTPATRQAGSLTNPGSMGGLNPVAGAGAQQKGLETAVTGQTQAATNQWETGQTQSAQRATDANNLINTAKAFHTSYKGAAYRGARYGSLPSQGVFVPPTASGKDLSQEQLADRYANQMAVALTGMNEPGHATDSTRSLFANLKMNRALDEGAEDKMYHSTLATAERWKEEQDFYNYIRSKNPDVTKPEADSLFNSYNTQMPPYNFETLNPLPKNKGKWKLYATPEAVSSLRQNGTYEPKAENNSPKNVTSESPKKFTPPDSKGRLLVIEKRTKQKGYIPSDRLEDYMANGYERI